MANLTKNQLISKLSSAGVKESEDLFTIKSIGSIETNELEKITSSKGKHYFRVGNYLLAVKDAKIFEQQTVTVSVITANKDYGKMKAGDCFAVAE